MAVEAEVDAILAECPSVAILITSREGLRRQRQYIGRLMRDVDAEPIRNALHFTTLHGQTNRSRAGITGDDFEFRTDERIEQARRDHALVVRRKGVRRGVLRSQRP